MTGPLVVKIGGRVAADPGAVLDDLAGLAGCGTPTVLVHGGGTAVDELCGSLGVGVRRYVSASGVISRATDPATLDAVLMALAGRVKPALVSGLQSRGVRAAGLTGLDAGTVCARRKTALRVRDGERVRVVRDDLTGRIVDVSVRLLTLLLADGVVPVLSPPALGEDGPLNVDADRLAARVAAALGARCLVFLTDVPGVLRDPADPSSVLARLDAHSPGELVATGGMRQKLLAGREALDAGVARLVIGSGLRADPVRSALAGAGTVVEPCR
ncbi:MAG TPA: [LysW]-aminoadipate kinase [Pseudonocardiaceae bacterium]